MNYRSIISTTPSLFLLLPGVVRVSAHSEEAESGFTLGVFLLIMTGIAIVAALAILLLKHFESEPGSLPIRKLAIAAGLTIVINGIIIAILYREVLF